MTDSAAQRNAMEDDLDRRWTPQVSSGLNGSITMSYACPRCGAGVSSESDIHKHKTWHRQLGH